MISISNIWKQLAPILSILNIFHSLEVVDRASETQLQASENSDWIIWRLKGESAINIHCKVAPTRSCVSLLYRDTQSSGFGSRSRRFERNKNVSSPSTCESQYCREPPWPRGSVLGLRPPGLEFRILCLEDSGISIISPSSGGSPGPV